MPVLFRGPSTALIPDLMNTGPGCMIEPTSASITDGGDSEDDFESRGGWAMVEGGRGFLE
jgi:hypothetical protein